MIKIKDIELIGEGTVKHVYQHPCESCRVIKIIKPELVNGAGRFAKHGALKGNLHQGVYRQFRREIIQYLQLCKQTYSNKTFLFPMETPYGFVHTDQGLGLVVEKIVAPCGKGRSLEDLAKSSGLELKHHRALAAFFDECVRLHLVFGEVNYAGLMYTEERRGRPEFVLVDGIGEKLLIPMRSWFPSINARYIRTVQRRIQAQLEVLTTAARGN